MNVNEVQRQVNAIKEMKGDPEAAHLREDNLYEDVLRYIASGPNLADSALATEALKTKDLDFPRWYA